MVIKGELLKRVRSNRRRLGDKLYRYPDIYHGPSGDWPGDFPGRAILSLASLALSLSGHPKEKQDLLDQLEEVLMHLDEETNEDGYFGSIIDPLAIDEQQLAGNSWFLRGLCASYRLLGDERLKERAIRISKSFVKVLQGHYEHYPLLNHEDGAVSGYHSDVVTDGWIKSTDDGCAFILLDGLTDVYGIDGDESLKSLIDSIILALMKIDFVASKFQTHATLTCLRAIFRYYEATKNEKLFKFVVSSFSRYIDEGMTYDYANFNWFGKKDSWTEPCCIVDSWILSLWLYEKTKEKRYLDLFRRIYVNNIRTCMRDNGGAGCSSCAHDDQYELKMVVYEASFCCTMRMGEGFARLIEHLHQNDSIIFGFSFEDEGLSISCPSLGSGTIKLETKGDYTYHLLVPRGFSLSQNIKGVSLKDEQLTIQSQGSMNIPFILKPYEENGFHFEGDAILRKTIDKGFVYLSNHEELSESELKEERQLLK